MDEVSVRYVGSEQMIGTRLVLKTGCAERTCRGPIRSGILWSTVV